MRVVIAILAILASGCATKQSADKGWERRGREQRTDPPVIWAVTNTPKTTTGTGAPK